MTDPLLWFIYSDRDRELQKHSITSHDIREFENSFSPNIAVQKKKGQCFKIRIAVSFCSEPSFVQCDEPLLHTHKFSFRIHYIFVELITSFSLSQIKTFSYSAFVSGGGTKENTKRDMKTRVWCLVFRVHSHPERSDHQTKMTERPLKKETIARNNGKIRRRSRLEFSTCYMCITSLKFVQRVPNFHSQHTVKHASPCFQKERVWEPPPDPEVEPEEQSPQKQVIITFERFLYFNGLFLKGLFLEKKHSHLFLFSVSMLFIVI